MFSTMVDFIHLMDLERILAVFAFVLLIEMPRLLIAAFTILWRTLLPSPPLRLPDARPCISVFIPVHNDGGGMRASVQTLRAQRDVEVQIIVINEGSTDDTHEIAQALHRHGDIDEYVCLQARGGKAAAANLALRLSVHPFFLVTDCDTTFEPHALALAVHHFADPHVAAVGGNLRVRNAATSIWTRFQELNYGFSIYLGRLVRDKLGFYFVASGAFGLFRTEVVRSLGGWNFGPGEDGDISTRIRLAGYHVRFEPLATALTDVPVTARKLARQRFRWDRSMIRLRLRKFGAQVLNPFNKQFSFPLALSFLDIYYLQILVPTLYIFYVLHLLVDQGMFALFYLIEMQCLYLMIGFSKFLCWMAISPDRVQDWRLLYYLPGYSLINIYFLRMVKLAATINELLFRGSYTDSYVPHKVRRVVQRY